MGCLQPVMAKVMVMLSFIWGGGEKRVDRLQLLDQFLFQCQGDGFGSAGGAQL